jgi:hypothetical protein
VFDRIDACILFQCGWHRAGARESWDKRAQIGIRNSPHNLPNAACTLEKSVPPEYRTIPPSNFLASSDAMLPGCGEALVIACDAIWEGEMKLYPGNGKITNARCRAVAETRDGTRGQVGRLARQLLVLCGFDLPAACRLPSCVLRVKACLA